MIAVMRNLKDTPFSIDRLFVWAVGACLVISVIGIAALSVLQIQIPPQIQSIAMVSLGSFVTMITREKR